MTAVSPVRTAAIHKSYAKRKVLENIDFALTPGEIFGLIGVNGAGKTTLIKILLDLAKADEGGAFIFDIPTTHIDARAKLSYLPEKFQPSRYLKGMEYLDLALSYYGKSLDRDVARKQAEAFDLRPEALDARVGSYSKGMGQKLGLLGAFMVGASLLVLDEPMSGLDPGARIKLKSRLLEEKAAGRTIFFSSHILSDIDEICDRIGVIHDGRLAFIGTPAEFKSRQGESSLEKAFLKVIGK
jgi:ABC-2 type transport system ATP-binding protein